MRDVSVHSLMYYRKAYFASLSLDGVAILNPGQKWLGFFLEFFCGGLLFGRGGYTAFYELQKNLALREENSVRTTSRHHGHIRGVGVRWGSNTA